MLDTLNIKNEFACEGKEIMDLLANKYLSECCQSYRFIFLDSGLLNEDSSQICRDIIEYH
jgi:hypothetical protein